MTKRSASRYPGIRSFERNEQGLFFGRQRETQALFEAVKVKPLTVLFSQSGIGKTSLLNAGLAPLLEQNGFLPIVIRLQDTSISPIETLQKVLAEYLDEAKLRQFGRQPYSLWEYVRACAFGQSTVADAEQPVPTVPVLLFDQFEELFSHDKSRREALTLALADLLNERLPEEVRLQLRNYPRDQRSNELLEWYNPLKIKIVFAIRADRMSDLDALKHHIPTVLHDRFHLKPLSHENAREAIIKPAALRASDFALTTSDFEYAPAAVQEMLDALDNEQGEIESFQLQLLCSYLENKVTRKGQVITSADFGGKAGVAIILNDYYEREIGALNPAEQLAARQFIEEGLIVNGRRVGLPEGTEQSRFGIGPELLGKLLNSRLLRSEMIHLGKIYELSHDTLIEPILRSYEKRYAEEELRRAEQLLAEERLQLAEIQRKRARARLFAITGFALFGLALLGGGFAWYNFRQAQTAQKRAEVTALAAKAWNIYRDDQTLAFRIAQFAYESDTSNAEALQTVQKIVNEPTTAYYQTIFNQHKFEVQCLAFSPDGQHVASGGLDSEVYIWDKSGSILQHFTHQKGESSGNRQTGPVQSVHFARDGRRLYSADLTGEVKIWDLTADTLWMHFKTQRFLSEMALSPDERLLITCGKDSTAKIWDLTGRLLHTLKGHNGPVTSVAFSADNQLIATGGGDKTARIWNMNGSCKQVIQLSGVSVVNDVQFSPDSRTLALACNDNTARLFDREGKPLNTLSGHTAEVSRVLFSPDGQYLLTASYDHTAKLWNLSGEEVLRLAGHSERLSAVAFSPDGNWLATGGFDFQAKLWSLAFNLQNKFNRHSNYVNKVKVAPDGSYLISGSSDFTVKKWNFAGDLMANMTGHKTSITSVEISPDGKTFASTSNDKNIRLWTADGQPLRTITDSRADVLKAVFTADNQYLVSCNYVGEIAVYDAKQGHLAHKWQATPGTNLQSIALSPDGQRIYSGGGDGRLRAWNLQGDSLWSATVGAGIWAVAVSPDGKSILTAAKQLPIKIWDASGQLRKDCYGHQTENYFVTWSPDGEKFVSCSWDKTAKIWDKNGNCLQTLPHPDGVYGADFTPDSRKVVTACRDKIIRVWEIQTGKQTNTIGFRTDIRPFFDSPHIANLDAIIFDWEKYGIATALATKIYRNKPGNLTRHGLQLMGKALDVLGDYQGCSRYLSEAERILLTARQLDTATPPTANYDSLVAEVYSIRANLLLLNRDFEQMVTTARAGMQFKALDFLKVYEVNGLLLSGKFDEAVQKAGAIKNEKVQQISFYPDMTFGEVFNEELVFYEDQYGIQCRDKERFIEQLK